MTEREWLERRFLDERPHLHSVAARILDSVADADDALQEAWLRLRRVDAGTIENPMGWLSTVVARVSLDMLRARTTRAQPGLPSDVVPPPGRERPQEEPESEAVLLDSLAGALVVIMDALSPAQRVAFVLHEAFAVPFDRIAAELSCSPEAARQHASRARRRVRIRAREGVPRTARHGKALSTFRAAAGTGDVRQLVAVLHPWERISA
jgi:RNA polymerase sigma-70 factor (ECF subfamily)